MNEIVIRFLIGGLVVSVFAVIGDLFKPKSFAGLFGAAPSVALATLGLTIVADGSAYAALEARSMLAGAIALLIYSSCVGWLITRYKAGATLIALCTIPIWLGVSLALCYTCFR
jgi:Protein of unknown function (DUF3147)